MKNLIWLAFLLPTMSMADQKPILTDDWILLTPGACMIPDSFNPIIFKGGIGRSAKDLDIRIWNKAHVRAIVSTSYPGDEPLKWFIELWLTNKDKPSIISGGFESYAKARICVINLALILYADE